jgi:membrane associated rhomboid family serine protease
MIPLRDTIRSESFPLVNALLIAANVLVFLFESALSTPSFERLIGILGLVPSRFPSQMIIAWPTLFTSTFLHGSWGHLISSMWVLFLFGGNVEDRMGPMRYLAFYMASGVIAGMTQVILSAGSSSLTSSGSS